ncbi:hypothetical protein QNH36_12860 [Mesobacillus sp. AQ2]|nr:hypothetical protein [Mesobacillus sp. AQ2]WHX38593.1 hypothetical protein QNH36_12860 [Mesobacillus sp. AQ2]
MTKVFNDLLKEREKDLVDKIHQSISDNQPDTFLKLARQSQSELYKEQIGKLIRLLERIMEGESVDQDILDWGTRVSEDKVRQGLSLS